MRERAPDLRERAPHRKRERGGIVIRAALAYARLGWMVLPLLPSSKEPHGRLVRHGLRQATDDPRVIEEWWSRCPRANVGIRLDHVLVVDLDTRHQGHDAWRKIVDGRELPNTPRQRTPTGGEHLVFARPSFPTVAKLALGVDVLSGSGHYIVAAPSVRAEGRYSWDRAWRTPVARLPSWLAELVGRREPVVPPSRPIVYGDRVEERARKYLEGMGPAVSGSGGHAHTFRAAQVLVRGFGLKEEAAWSLLADWNQSCKPPWSENALRRKLEQALACGKMAHGAMLVEGR